MTLQWVQWTGKYVEILEEPNGYPGIVPHTIGHVITDRWLGHDGTVCVDVFDSRHEEIVNLNFYPRQLKLTDETELQSHPPLSERGIQYSLLKDFDEKLKEKGLR